MDFKQNHYGSWKYFLHLSYENTQLLFCRQRFLIFSWDKHEPMISGGYTKIWIARFLWTFNITWINLLLIKQPEIINFDWINNNLHVHSQVWDNFSQMKVLLKWWKMLFYFTVKTLFILKIFKVLSWMFGQILWRHSLVKKQLQSTYCLISQEVKAIRQLNFVS